MNNEMTTDNMSNEEVIEVLKGIVFNGFDRTTRKERQALDIAIKALEKRPQGDLISREALREAFKAWKTMDDYYHSTDCNDIPFSEAFDLIDNAPTVQLDESVIQEVLNKRCMTAVANEYLVALHGKRPQGEWKRLNTIRCNCSNCGFAFDDYGILFNFCPNCGAYMRKGGAK